MLSGAVPVKAPTLPALTPLEIYQKPAAFVAEVAGTAEVVIRLEPAPRSEFLGEGQLDLKYWNQA